MQKFRYGLIALSLLLCSTSPATADVSIGIGLPNVSIGINLPLFPELVPVPGYPVYYAPSLQANYFFYDGMYWVYQDDNWYASSWYNGPWAYVAPEVVPLFILRVPVRYYRQPPVYFRGWYSNAPPRWGQHWGHSWEQRRRGWDRWQRGSAPARAPLPVYQRRYTGDRYPRVEQQHQLRSQSYRYQPRDRVIRQHYQRQLEQRAPAPSQRGRQEQPSRSPRQQEIQRPAVQQQDRPDVQRQQQRGGPDVQRPQQQRGGPDVQRAVPAQPAIRQRSPESHEQRQQPRPAERVQQAPRGQDQAERRQERGESHDSNRGQGQGRDDERGRGRDR
jgi:hypothetical protein